MMHTIYGIETHKTKHLQIIREIKKKYGVGTFLQGHHLNYVIEYLNYWRGENLGIERVQIVREPHTGVGKGIKCYLFGEDFGETISIKYSKPTQEQKLKAAFRDAIKEIVMAFKRRAFERQQVIRCPIDNIPVEKHNSHVDHYDMEFQDVYLTFMEYNSLSPGEIGIRKSSSGVGFRLADENLEREFIEYHNANTHLRIVSRSANLSTLRKKNSNS